MRSEDPHVTVRFEDPFLPPVDQRRADRRLRGRLVAPVTVWTAGRASKRAGLTVSSLLVAEGEPPEILGLLDPLCELRAVMEDEGRFLVHVLDESDRRLAAGFAGEYPADPFEGLEVLDTASGPAVAGARTVVACQLTSSRRVGYQDLVTGAIEVIDLSAAATPLARYRGRYRTLKGEG